MDHFINIFSNILYMKETRIFVLLFLIQLIDRIYHPETYIFHFAEDLKYMNRVIDKTIQIRRDTESKNQENQTDTQDFVK